MNNLTCGNALSFLRFDLQNHRVKVKLPGRQDSQDPTDGEAQDCYLIIMRGKTKLAEEFMAVYPEETKMANLVSKILGTEEIVCDYGVLLDENLRIIFAFNRLFADYDHEKQEVIFKTPDQVLIEQLNNGFPLQEQSPADDPSDEQLFPLPRRLKRGRPRRLPDQSNLTTLYGIFPDDSSGTAMIKYSAFPAADANTEPSASAD
ncbi:MAG: hypothetical protein WCT16_02045 [Candidatus Buchananbacteria bacterium]